VSGKSAGRAEHYNLKFNIFEIAFKPGLNNSETVGGFAEKDRPETGNRSAK
jgi:hypothetical protein